MRNKLEKFLISLSGFLAFGLILLGIKIQDDGKKIQNFSENLKNTELVPAPTEDKIQPEPLVDFPPVTIDVGVTNPIGNGTTSPLNIGNTQPSPTPNLNVGKTAPPPVPVVIPPANKKTRTS